VRILCLSDAFWPDHTGGITKSLLTEVEGLVELGHELERLQIPTRILVHPSYGRPILATDLPETRGAIKDSGAGMLVPDTVDGLAQGIVDLFSTSLDELNQLGANALRSVREKHSWRHRAQQILDTLSELRMAKQEGAS